MNRRKFWFNQGREEGGVGERERERERERKEKERRWKREERKCFFNKRRERQRISK